MNVLVNGGAGYIGSHMTRGLLDKGYSVTVADSLENGFSDAVDSRARLEVGNLLDKKFVESIFSKSSFDAVIHFAAYIQVGESMENPAKYFENNIQTVVNVLNEMHKNKVEKFIFSSTAAVYGNPETIPIPETHSKHPTNVYGETKLIVERILDWYQELFGLRFVALRYFNACGASLDSMIGERHKVESHIIPNALRAAYEGSEFQLYGTDYDTPDGTALRDYIHVLDLVEAHLLSLLHIENNEGGYIYNVGTGEGRSNKEIISMIEKVANKTINVKQVPRRSGDSSRLIADPTKIKKELNFEPTHSELEIIIKSAWEWYKKLHNEK